MSFGNSKNVCGLNIFTMELLTVLVCAENWHKLVLSQFFLITDTGTMWPAIGPPLLQETTKVSGPAILPFGYTFVWWRWVRSRPYLYTWVRVPSAFGSAFSLWPQRPGQGWTAPSCRDRQVAGGRRGVEGVKEKERQRKGEKERERGEKRSKGERETQWRNEER